MEFTLWYLIAGAVLVVMALTGSLVERLPLTTALLYLGVGAALGPLGAGLIRLDLATHSGVLERVTELAVIFSLFTAGLKLRAPVADPLWWLPVRLASLSMAITVGLMTLAGTFLLGLPVGAAVLLGAILAPTDPVLASDVQVEDATDRDQLRFSLTGEAGLNDGPAFPFVMLGLGLLGLHDIGTAGWRWLVIDVIWATTGGLAIGWICGTLVGRIVLYLRRTHREAVGLDDFLALGLIAISYGVGLYAHTYGFLAVFAAGLALRRVEARATNDAPPRGIAAEALGQDPNEIATDPEKAPAYMAQAVLGFNEQLERIGAVAVMVLVGGMLIPYATLGGAGALWLAPLLFLVIRPLAIGAGLLGSRTTGVQRLLISWFGVRGVGSIYYLMFALQHGLPPEFAQPLTALTLGIVAVSIVVHGISVTPLMNRYARSSATLDAG
ncbi:MAG TPA: cation:proton antiporter [Chloroflexota bacterium]|nr:cation:proton antiporter [Chloroflexota bacterium]